MKTKKILMIAVPVTLVILGGVGYAGYTRIIVIPGITPPKQKFTPVSKDPRGGPIYNVTAPMVAMLARVKTENERLAKIKPAAAPVVKKAVPLSEAGVAKLAALWNEIETPKLAMLTKEWPIPDLARILLKMDEEKVAKLLVEVEVKRSATLCVALKSAADSAAAAKIAAGS